VGAVGVRRSSGSRNPWGPPAGGVVEGAAPPPAGVSQQQAPASSNNSGNNSKCLQCLATGRPPPSPGAACPHGVVGSGGVGAAGSGTGPAAGRGLAGASNPQQQQGGVNGSSVMLPVPLEGAVAAAARLVAAAEGTGGVVALMAGATVAPAYEPSFAGGSEL
jgi:hypothetical protein